MTPLYFRGCVLISEKILSYDEFMSMPYFDFIRLEKMIAFKNDMIKDKTNRQKTDKVKSELSGLQGRSVKGLFDDDTLKKMGYEV